VAPDLHELDAALRDEAASESHPGSKHRCGFVEADQPFRIVNHCCLLGCAGFVIQRRAGLSTESDSRIDLSASERRQGS
jgi:hypothetical protein